jgi:hypothetical protein
MKMDNKKFLTIVMLAVVVLGVLLISGCSKKECSASSDCPADSCHTAKCSNDKCIVVPKENCCGNGKCEIKFGESRCGCPDDCKPLCSGKVKYNITYRGAPKPVDAKYAEYMCDNNKECIIGVDPSLVTEHPLSTPIEDRNVYKADLITTFNQPFNTATDNLKIRVSLNDLEDNVAAGLLFTKIKVMNGAVLMGEKVISDRLSSVGSEFTEELPLTSSQSIVEEEKTVNVEVYYEYNLLDSKGVSNLVRSSKNIKLAEKIMIVVPD